MVLPPATCSFSLTTGPPANLVFTACLQPSEEFKGILGVAVLEVLDSFLDRAMKRCSLLVVEVVAAAGQDFVERDELDLRAFGAAVGSSSTSRPFFACALNGCIVAFESYSQPL